MEELDCGVRWWLKAACGGYSKTPQLAALWVWRRVASKTKETEREIGGDKASEVKCGDVLGSESFPTMTLDDDDDDHSGGMCIGPTNLTGSGGGRFGLIRVSV
ncbi:hypothetical protein Hanom_Chr02g00134241 [Helianthus anomalus]